ncbi:GDSL esterase/lipase At5g55050-like [Argentina anserina]|uniref:GDSL esterase/lipase At5g55050-like n=1 Tax=Argentina anserina TaxID=57926 RepID=UPI00217667F1|nr:GDSL esterase/lipase At5g55050-like [Potentilla anserina]
MRSQTSYLATMAYNSFSPTVFVFLIFLVCLLSYSVTEARLIPAMYVFGDSLVDAGNNNYLKYSFAKANFPHNGIDFPTKKPTGRFCNGKNAADLIAEKMGLPTIPPYLSMSSKSNKSSAQFLNGVNFASAASKILNDIDPQYPFSIPLEKQVDYYLAVHKDLVQGLGVSRAQNHLSKSMFLITTGNNDIYNYFDSLSNSTQQQYVSSLVHVFKEQVKRLYGYGARKFSITGVGVIGCTPSERNEQADRKCDEDVNRLAIKYNQALVSMLKNLTSEFRGINYSYFDGYSVMLNFIQKPTIHGFSEVKAACCGLGKLNADAPCLPFATYCSNRSDHLFWDRTHPTEAAHRKLVDYILYGPLRYSFPVNVKKLVAI